MKVRPTRTLKQPNITTQSKMYKFAESNDDETNKQWATLKDLCPEDKSKIGQLIQSLASAKEERSNIAKELKDKTKSYRRSIKKINQYSDQVIQDQKCTEIKFKESLDLLKQYQIQINHLNHAEQSKQQSPQSKHDKPQIQSEQYTFEDPTKIKQLLIQHSEKNTDSFEFLKRKTGESEQKLKQGDGMEYKSTTEFRLQREPQQQNNVDNPISEIQKLKIEIEEITNGLKQIQFNQDASQNNESPLKFQQQFIQFEARMRENDQIERKLLDKQLPKKFLASPVRDSSSDSDDVQLARKLISIKKEQNKNRQSKESLASTRPQQSTTRPQQTTTRVMQQLQTTPSSKKVTSDLQRFNTKLDQKLHSILASSQSYNLSLTQTQQQDYSITPLKNEPSSITTPADYLKSASNLKSQKESQTTPQPLRNLPKIYVENDPAARCLFFKSDRDTKSIQDTKSVKHSQIQSHVDEQEIDCLIDSLNNKPSRSYFYNHEEVRPRQLQSSKMNYNSNLYDMIHNIESPQGEVNASLAPEQYQKYMDQYEKIVEQYDLQDDDD